ncbi:exodeoxyribonuclease V subunit alpha [Alteromonas sp. a30]|uniref:exodeoxyribonuclease V subunit alpha n=1 Tax=Alteromonas sp. a30 TaxID=2730917 RepID=UPI00227FB3EB|nr:exodeoxyribonuclease V subunit alpha [Alteromonas sp. a30]MCY7293963.1 exodeoxyribonuclease V subunit alpha [Alteromonas sp. a30]
MVLNQLLFNRDNATFQCLDTLYQKGQMRAIDKAFGVFLADTLGLEPAPSQLDWVALLGALTSQQLGQQHTCVDIRLLSQMLPNVWSYFSASDIHVPDTGELLALLHNDPRVRVFSDEGNDNNEAPLAIPLVLEGDLLYLHKYWAYETQLMSRLAFFAQQETYIANVDQPTSMQGLHHDLQALFPRSNTLEQGETDWQKVAVAVAAVKPFCIITGGPGTGKTTTVAKLLWLLTKYTNKDELVVKLAAPTGKAAARLNESLRDATNKLPEGANIAPDECTTIHRLLGVKRHSAQFHHDENNPLKLDILIVDEASMIDLPLLSKLFQAIPDHARVILLGDNNQLASVEVGSVLGDICSTMPQVNVFSPTMSKLLTQLTDNALTSELNLPAIANNLVHLRKSYRFDEQSGIGQLAKAINSGQGGLCMDVLRHPQFADLEWHQYMQHSTLIDAVSEHWQHYFQAANQGQAKVVFHLLSQLQVLCMQRAGPWGIEAINALFEQHFSRQGLINARTEYYAGRPIMIVENDHRLGLYNGDIGVVLPNQSTSGEQSDANALLRVWFVGEDGKFTHFLSGQLPKHETVYAMTTHKSQGSEFKRVILCMPSPETEAQRSLLSRELFYTGVTRAKQSFVLISEPSAIHHAVKQRCIRASGLAERLRQGR